MKKTIRLFLILSLAIATLASCGAPHRQAEPVEFAPDALEWGMSQQEVLDTLMLREDHARTERMDIPAEENMVSRTVTKISCDNLVFEDLPLRVTFTFTAYHAESEWDIGLSKLYIEVYEDSVNAFSNLKNIIGQSSLNAIVRWETLSESEREKMHDFHQSVFPNTTDEFTEMVNIGAAGGECMPSEDAEGVYYAYSLETNGLGVWNRYVKNSE